ncbi:MAG: winged helix-turn-helix transcriptional regulator [Acidobacteriota bacterium]|nr:winged helix-turn-helix transcriptional regulator [Acidobacteriota bacterium]
MSRTVYPTNPTSVEYDLTELGRSLLVPAGGLTERVSANQANISRARVIYDE